MLRSCLSSIGCATVLVAAGLLGWIERDEITRRATELWERREARLELAASAAPAAASAAEAKIVALGRGERRQITLTAEELAGWVRHGLRGFFPEFVGEVAASIDDDERLVLEGPVAVREVPGAERLGPAVWLVGDTAGVVVRGRLDSLEPGRGVFYVEEVQIGALPLPDPIRDELISGIVVTQEQLPSNAVPFELPEFVTDVGVRGGELFLRGSPRGRR